MHLPPKRPVAVWIAQIFLLIYAAFFILTIVFGVLDNETLERDYEGEFFGSFFCSGVSFLCIASCAALALRRRWGRWLTVLLLGGILSLFVAAAYDDPFAYASEDPDYWFFVWSVIILVFYTPCFMIISAFLLDPKVKRFLSGTRAED